MNETAAWNRFCQTGSIADYLVYKEVKACAGSQKDGGKLHETEYGRDHFIGTDYSEQQTPFNSPYS